jgi:insertion element IS1 protein InsB
MLSLLIPFQRCFITRNDWGSYTKEVSREIYLTGRVLTQRIESNNLIPRTHIKRLVRKTICRHHSFETYRNVIGIFYQKTPLQPIGGIIPLTTPHP